MKVEVPAKIMKTMEIELTTQCLDCCDIDTSIKA